MDLELATCFAEVAKTKSISQASKNLNMTQPALSKKIKSLEDYLSTDLFTRNVKGVSLTKEGTFFLENIQSILEQFDQLVYEIRNLSATKYISLGVLSSIATYILPDKLVELEKNNTRIDLYVSNITRDLITRYKQNKLNVLIIESDYKDELEDSYEELLFVEQMHVVMPTNHQLAKKDKVSLKDLELEPFILYPKDCPVHRAIKNYFHGYHIQPLIITEIPFSESIMSLVSCGKGITLLPEIITKNNHAFNVAVMELEQPIQRSISVFAKDSSLKNYLSSRLK